MLWPRGCACCAVAMRMRTRQLRCAVQHSAARRRPGTDRAERGTNSAGKRGGRISGAARGVM